MTAHRRRQRAIRRQRQRSSRRGLIVVDDHRIVAGAMPVPPGYWMRRLRVTRSSGIRIRAMRPVPR